MRLRNVVKQALKFFKVSHTLKAPIPYLLWSFVLKLKLSKFENKLKIAAENNEGSLE